MDKHSLSNFLFSISRQLQEVSMKKLFIHNPVFRLLSPVFSGCLVYVLVLLIGNNVGQILEQFFGKELLFCIFLSYLSQEFSRFALLVFDRLFDKYQSALPYRSQLVLQVLSSIALIVILVSLFVYLFYYLYVGFSPNSRELIIFNSIFTCINGIYIALHLSHQFLYRENTQRLGEEFTRTEQVEEDFHIFRKGLNPTLLFESLESLIVLIHEGPGPAEEFIDQFATVYRYILSNERKDLIPFSKEEEAMHTLIDLFAHLPFRNPRLKIQPNIDTYVVPGTLLHTLELIVRSSIPSPKLSLEIEIQAADNRLTLSYKTQERLDVHLGLQALADLQKSYSFYSEEPIEFHEKEKRNIISFPILQAYPLEEEADPTEIQKENSL